MTSQTDAWAWAAWDAVETAERLAKKDVSPAEVLEAAVRRTEDAASLNAVVTTTFDRARERLSRPPGPLAGIPFFVKDLAQVEGVRTTWGSAASGHFVSKKSDQTGARLEALGATTLGKSTTPEFGLISACEPIGFEPTRNPWRPSHSTGGSSGGAAALVAAGVVPIAHASDGGGSIRIPASCCGLVGLKPTRGRFDMDGSDLLPLNIACNGVVSRTVRDTISFWSALERAQPPRRLAPIGEVRPEPGRALRIGYWTDASTGAPVDPEVKAAVEQAARRLAALGHHVEPVPAPVSASFTEDFVCYWGLVAFLQSRTAKAMLARTFDPSKWERWTVEVSAHFLAHKWATAQAVRRLRAFHRTWAAFFDRHEVLLCPTLAQLPQPLGHFRTDQPFEVLLERVIPFTPFTPPHNAAGAPGLSLPLAQSKDGLPIGVQLSARAGEEALLLSLGLQLEAAHPWPRLAPRANWAR